jgi:hypothetical protein
MSSSGGTNIPGVSFGVPSPASGEDSKVVRPYADLSTIGQDQLALSQQGPGAAPQKKGGVVNFIKGIGKGAVNTITSLFTPQGLAIALGSAALLFVTAGAALPFLIAAGVIGGGITMGKGFASGDMEKAGEGFFGVGASLVGAKVSPRVHSETKAGGKSYAYTNKKGEVKGTFGSLVSSLNPFSKMKEVARPTKEVPYTAVEGGATTSSFRVAGSNVKSTFKPSRKEAPKTTEPPKASSFEDTEKQLQANAEKLKLEQRKVDAKTEDAKAVEIKEKAEATETGKSALDKAKAKTKAGWDKAKGKTSGLKSKFPEINPANQTGQGAGLVNSSGLMSGGVAEQEEVTPEEMKEMAVGLAEKGESGVAHL